VLVVVVVLASEVGVECEKEGRRAAKTDLRGRTGAKPLRNERREHQIVMQEFQ
jgi:hypothetical protein